MNMTFKEALQQKDFVVAAELPLTPDSSRESMIASASAVRDAVDGFVLTDNQYGQTHMSPMSAAIMLSDAGLPVVLQLSCRNRNRIALIGELLGARAAGIDSLLLVRGAMVPKDYKPKPTVVTDLGVRQLIAIAKTINDDEQLGSSHDFLIGASATVHAPKANWHPEELLAKADAGAQMVVTQLCMDVAALRKYMDFLVATKLVRRLSVIVSVAIATSPEMAVWLRDHRRRAIVPAAYIERLRKAEDASEEGISACAELLGEIAQTPGVSGINFVAAGSLGMIPDVLVRAGLAPRS